MASLFFFVGRRSVGSAIGHAFSSASLGFCIGLCGLQMCLTAKGGSQFQNDTHCPLLYCLH